MEKTFSIGEISKLLGIPASTLRFWERQGLINLERNEQNHYREYSLHTAFNVTDLAYYRYLNMPIQEMKKVSSSNPEDLEKELEQLDKNLEQELNKLYSARTYLRKRLDYMKEYQRLVDQPYQYEMPNFDKIYYFSYEDANAWKISIEDQYQNMFLYNSKTGQVELGLDQPSAVDSKSIWEANCQVKNYAVFPMRVDYINPTPEQLNATLEHFKKSGIKTGNIVARYLFSAFEEKQYDYYKAFIEIIDK